MKLGKATRNLDSSNTTFHHTKPKWITERKFGTNNSISAVHKPKPEGNKSLKLWRASRNNWEGYSFKVNSLIP